MRSRLSTFSSRVLGSALLWTVLAAVLIEWHAGRALPARHPAHEVDRLLYDLDQGRIPARGTVFLGDSVGRQIAYALLPGHPGAFAPLACNAAIETPGQYFLFRRYLENHPVPDRLILMMGYPVGGNLAGNYTENYVQRCFLRLREIAGLARAKRSLRFGIVMLAYKFSPVFRHRVALQRLLPRLQFPVEVAESPKWTPAAATDPGRSRHGILDLVGAWWTRRGRQPDLAEIYFRRLARLLEKRQIAWVCLPLPLPESDARQTAPTGNFGRQVQRVRELAADYPQLRACDRFFLHPGDWFRDGTHLHKEYLPVVAAEYDDLLTSLDFKLAGP